MNQSVHDNSTQQSRLKTVRFANCPERSGPDLKRRLLLTFLGGFTAFAAMAQTYTTKADGPWNNAATWVGGSVPSTTIGAAQTVIIKHDVTFNQTSVDFNISGKLNIEGDTLRFPTAYNRKVTLASTGTISVKNGGFIQPVATGGVEMEILGGRMILENAR